MIHRTNRSGLFQGQIRVIQPIEKGLVSTLNDQDGLFTLISRGIEEGKIVNRLADEWELGADFKSWLQNHNDFLNTLVDRIVTGYPKDEIDSLRKELNYRDDLINTAEVFNLWVIEGNSRYAEEFPLKQAGCNVIWTDDMSPYRTRKVRILIKIN